jgi:NitT/TauT family transport system substrate-binding protein
MKKLTILAFTVLTLFSLLAAACGSQGNSSTPTASQPIITSTLTTTSTATSTTTTTSTTTSTVAVTKLDTIRLVGTIGPMSIPLAYMVENNSLASVANKTTLDIWATPAQLQAIVTGTQGDFLSLPSNAAATFYNKGVKLQYLDNSIWNILYVVTPDNSIQSMADLKGKKVVVPYQNAVPDAMFQSLCKQKGLAIPTDITVTYTPDPIQASQMLLTGSEKYVLLSEPSATAVIIKGKAAGQTFLRAINIGAAWQNAKDGTSVTPVAGTIVMGDMLQHPDIVKVFMSEYAKAIDWMLANPVKAGEVGARALSQQGFTAPVLTASLNNINWRYVKAVDARPDLEDFFSTLSQVSPNFIGGKLPDNGFYYQP